MKVLVVDTETTGLPEKWNPSIFSQKEKWPHIIQLSYLLYDTNINKIISCVDEIIKLDYHIPISSESIKIHGINRTTSHRKGISINKALLGFYEAFEACDIVVGTRPWANFSAAVQNLREAYSSSRMILKCSYRPPPSPPLLPRGADRMFAKNIFRFSLTGASGQN